MNYFLLISVILFCCLHAVLSQISLPDPINYYSTQSTYNSQMYARVQAPFSIENILGSSLDMAMETCRKSFKWERWNCPNSDFILRRATQSLFLDPEDSYVNAITTAAVFYTITKSCSTGIIKECDTCSNNPYNTQCSDNPKAAEQLLKKHIHVEFADDFFGKISKHNYQVITNLFGKSLVKQCGCESMGLNGLCTKENCRQVLRPFEIIAADIHQMYDESIQLTNTPQNARIIWENIPLDALVYIKESPNYCELDAVPHWNGMHGRQCSTIDNGKNLTKEERLRCRYLCQQCGHTIQSKDIITENRCNCKLTWDFQFQCEMCVTVHKQYYCY